MLHSRHRLSSPPPILGWRLTYVVCMYIYVQVIHSRPGHRELLTREGTEGHNTALAMDTDLFTKEEKEPRAGRVMEYLSEGRGNGTAAEALYKQTVHWLVTSGSQAVGGGGVGVRAALRHRL